MTAWSCPHDLDDVCQRINGARCEPGMRGCVLEGKVRFANEALNQVRKPVKATPPATSRTGKATPPRRKLYF